MGRENVRKSRRWRNKVDRNILGLLLGYVKANMRTQALALCISYKTKRQYVYNANIFADQKLHARSLQRHPCMKQVATARAQCNLHFQDKTYNNWCGDVAHSSHTEAQSGGLLAAKYETFILLLSQCHVKTLSHPPVHLAQHTRWISAFPKVQLAAKHGRTLFWTVTASKTCFPHVHIVEKLVTNCYLRRQAWNWKEK